MPTPAGTPVDHRPLDSLLLEVRDLHVSFETPRGPLHAVNGVDFDLHRGRTLGVVGESGSGKSVMSKAIMGLLPRRGRTVGGSVRFDGTELVGLDDTALREFWGTEMAMIFQDPMTSLNPVMRIGRQITESLRMNLADMDRQTARATAIELLSAVHIPAPERRYKEYPGRLSGGMRQRVVIAVALACGPRLLFADEPTTALDVTVQAQILDLLQEQQRERFMAMILVTHDLGVVAGRADDIAVMYAGRIVEYAPTRTLFASMGHPYTHALMRSIPRLADPSHTRLDAIGGVPPNLVDPPRGCPFAPRCEYAQQRCLDERPELLTLPEDPGHAVACHFPLRANAPAEAEVG
ncbi:MAG: ABC transporter ATP-binding protein [Microthrixaceae bacterium]